ncbi:MAG: PP2C family protein-serine/threonine phosphatase [Verrucomicrobiales bacterium]|nr:serine/threonine-protein phosphatase [Verrucomicrobiota bacterium JB025]
MPNVSILEWAALTHSGTRKERNDDSLIAFASNPAGARKLPLEGTKSLAENDLVFAVSDGVGGGNAGDLASSLLLKRMAEIIPETFKIAASGFYPDCLDHLSGAIDSVHKHLNLAAEESGTHGMGATVALAWFTPENLYVCNVGDSRVYACRNGELKQLSRDHTSAWAQWKRGEISEIEYRTHPRRSALYEVIGGDHQMISPELLAFPYQPGDRFLVCSDGLIDGVWERHIRDALCNGSSPRQTTEILLKRSVSNAGIDDTTLITIHVTREPDDPAAPASEK